MSEAAKQLEAQRWILDFLGEDAEPFIDLELVDYEEEGDQCAGLDPYNSVGGAI